MSKSHYKNRFFSVEAWFFLILTILTQTVLMKYVDMTPHVDENFFFSSEDPNYQADIKISELFRRQDSQLIISVAGNIYQPSYQEGISQLTAIINNYDGVTSVKSITQGPKSIEDAIDSPLWQRALIAENKQSSNIIVILDESYSKELIRKIENLTSAMQANDFKIRISGFPFIVELIQRNLFIDLNIFSKLAFILFSIVILMIFHSWRILIGMIIACMSAGSVSFMINQLLGIKVGILTANLATIIFVLTLSHIVFLTFNWKHLHVPESDLDQYETARQAINLTISASFWSMFTTLLGFLSLLLVQAQPLRELGIGGAIGTVVAFMAAYIIYPEFLRLKKYPHDWPEKQVRSMYHKSFRFFDKNYSSLVILIAGIVIITSPSLWKLNTDPSLLTYFGKNTEILQGLEYIDHNGGSSPLIVVIKDKNGQTLNTRKMYRKMWTLQESLEKHPDVGTILSLPTLMAEGRRRPFSSFLTFESLLTRMESLKNGRIAESFITKDRRHGLMLIRMKENGRTKPRLEVIEEIETIVETHNFNAHLVGGIYALQGHLSQHVATSLIYGLGRLLLAFMIIGFIVSHSLRIGLAMTMSICAVPMCILGCIGYFGIPLDTISAPAANIAIAMGVDAMIHMVHAYRRIAKQGSHHLNNWLIVRRRLWEPITTSTLIICAGFGIFFFSSFPPTQRFGGAIVLGTICSAICALFVFPLFAKRHR